MSVPMKIKCVVTVFLGMAASVATAQEAASKARTTGPAPALAPAVAGVTTAGGVNGYLPVFTGGSTVVNSTVYQGTAGIGIGRIPNAMLDVNGKSIFRGGQVLSRTGDATTSAGAASYPFIVQSSVYNTSTKSNLLPYFQLQSEPTGNNTATTGATYNFLYYSGQGANPVETGLYFNPNGTIHFSPSQTFPITQGPAGPVGPTGPAGPAGSGGSGGSFALPLISNTDGDGFFVLDIVNSGTNAGGGISAQGAIGSGSGGTGGVGLTGVGGDAGTASGFQGGPGVQGFGGAPGITPDYYVSGGTGIEGFGASTTSTPNTFGGVGVYAEGGQGSRMGGSGIFVKGGNGPHTGFGGSGITAYPGMNGDDQFPADPTRPLAGDFEGPLLSIAAVTFSSSLSLIDDPIDPANKFLSHSVVESPDMMNIYTGNVVTDGRGDAVVTLPEYFEALNRDFRYQLTVIGQFAQAVVATEIANHAFTIKTDKSNVKVSWMVTGVRQDAWSNAHRVTVEVEKRDQEKGHYMHPELYGHVGQPNIMELNRPLAARALPKQ